MSKFDDFYSKKSVTELLEKLRIGKISPETIDKEWQDALIIHLEERELTLDEKKVFAHILSLDVESLKTDNQTAQLLQTEIRKEGSSFSGSEGSRYPALKTITGLISFLGYLVILIGGGIFFFMLSKDEGMMGFIGLVISIVIAIPLLAFSNLIQVFIDIEHNTRKTKEALKVINK